MIIYKATNTNNGKVYIGKYENKYLTTRRSGHRYQAFTLDSQFAFHRALRSYGWESFTWEVIDRAETKEELCEKEMYWISQYKSYTGFKDCNGYNMTLGGDGVSGFEITEEYREAMSHLTKTDVFELKKLLKESDLSSSQLCEKFKIVPETLARINKGKVWGYVQLTENDTFPYRSRERANQLKYNVGIRYNSLDEVLNIRLNYMLGLTLVEIMNKYNISYKSAYCIINLQSYSDVAIPEGYKPPKIKTQITDQTKLEIIKLCINTDLTQKKIGEMVGLSPSRVGQIVRMHKKEDYDQYIENLEINTYIS